MGRLMKNFDIGLAILCLHAEGPRVHLRACAHLLNALGDDSFAWFQPFCNNPFGTNTVTDRDRSNAHFVVATYNGNLITTLEL